MAYAVHTKMSIKRVIWNTKKADALEADDTRNKVGFEDCLI